MSKQKNNGFEKSINVSNINSRLRANYQKSKLSSMDLVALAEDICKGNVVSLSQGITLVESKRMEDQAAAQELIQHCLPFSGNSQRIGITGVPGVGKSTFIEALGHRWIQKNHKIAVLAVDPSSSISGGSILGDKTRMSKLVASSKAFIRPSAAGASLGGVAQKTKETIILCEAAGYDRIIVETVGVGQSETAVYHMTDFFLLLKLAGAGDELQGIKRGIIELADAILINKDDGKNQLASKKAKNQFNKALHLFPIKSNQWQPRVFTCSALHDQGIDEIDQVIKKYVRLTKQNKTFDLKRQNQNKNWLHQTIDNQLLTDFYQHKHIRKEISDMEKSLIENKITPFLAAELLLKKFKKA